MQRTAHRRVGHQLLKDWPTKGKPHSERCDTKNPLMRVSEMACHDGNLTQSEPPYHRPKVMVPGCYGAYPDWSGSAAPTLAEHARQQGAACLRLRISGRASGPLRQPRGGDQPPGCAGPAARRVAAGAETEPHPSARCLHAGWRLCLVRRGPAALAGAQPSRRLHLHRLGHFRQRHSAADSGDAGARDLSRRPQGLASGERRSGAPGLSCPYI